MLHVAELHVDPRAVVEHLGRFRLVRAGDRPSEVVRAGGAGRAARRRGGYGSRRCDGARARHLRRRCAQARERVVRLLRRREGRRKDGHGSIRRIRHGPDCIIDLACIHEALVGRRGVVCADRVPVRAELADVLRQDPRADIRVGARIEQALLRDAFARERRQPRAVDLHQADVDRAVRVGIDGIRIHARFDLRDAAQQADAHVLERGRVVETVGPRDAVQRGRHRERRGDFQRFTAERTGCLTRHGRMGRDPAARCKEITQTRSVP
ncbi:hypothetical protein BPS26883_06381 [Burkholderia pseudomultivorans]|uniref:Uncharacterized protein n=1 Tax=Burkholderia pseudomultivorans TaxID=1207504 RepID=A0A6P2R6A8_9BURK|nr:hypothetical protein BPS26883_06381 [Burkholderia pseudomultivorans]